MGAVRCGSRRSVSAAAHYKAFQVPATYRRMWDFSPDGIRRSAEDSLTRMGAGRFGMLFLHDAEEHFEEALRDGYPALAELRAEGTAGAIGTGMYDSALLARLVGETDADVVMLAGQYTLMNQRALDDLLPICIARGVGVLSVSVFNSGITATPRPAADATYDYAPAAPAVLQRARAIADIGEAHGVSLPQAAMAFPLRHPVVAGIVVGMRSAGEVHANVADFAAQIPETLWSELSQAALIRLGT